MATARSRRAPVRPYPGGRCPLPAAHGGGKSCVPAPVGADGWGRRGRLSKADRVRESGEAFRGARRARAAGGSAISNLEHRGLDRVGGHGKERFAGVVALAVLAANVHRPGLMPPARERPVLPAAA